MASAPAIHQKNQPLTQNEGPIATRLRSRGKIRDVQTSQTEGTGETDVNNQSDKPSRLSRNQKDKSKNSVAKKSEVHTACTSRTSLPSTEKRTKKKSNDSTPKSSGVHITSCTTSNPSKDQGTKNTKHSSETQRKQDSKNQRAKSKASQPQSETKPLSSRRTSQNSKNQEPKKIKSSAPKKSSTGEPSSSDLGKEKEKARPSQKLAKKSMKEHPIYHIRWKGFEKTTTGSNCALCEKDIAYLPNEEKWNHSIHEENELEYSIFSRMGEEQGQYSILPEAAILPCSHAFHSTCLSATSMQLSDPPCPICLSLL